MIGNDIIDLNEACSNSRWQRKGFLNKIFNENEKQFIHNCGNAELMVWLMWSMKESSYKIHSRIYKENFVPLKYKCEKPEKRFSGYHYKGTVNINKCRYNSVSIVSGDYISTTAVNNDFKEIKIFSGIVKFFSKDFLKQREENYQTLLKVFSENFSQCSGDFFIDKDEQGIPFLFNENKERMNCAVSFSHHGRFGACALAINSDL